MADIMSRIVMSIVGADEVDNKVRKMRNGFKEAGKAAQEIGADVGGAGGASPFDRATGGGGGGGLAPSRSFGGAGVPADPRSGMHFRDAEHRNRFTRGVTGGIDAFGQASAGNAMGGMSGGLSSIAGMLGKAGPVALIAAATVGAANAMANKDIDYRKQLFTTGLGQKLGAKSFEEIFSKTRGLGEIGLDYLSSPLLQGMASGGARSADAADMTGMGNLSYNYGLDASSIGKLYGRLQSAGGGGKTVYSGGVAAAAEAGFGRARMGEFYDTLTSAVENAMESGFQKGSSAFTDVYTKYGQRLADFGRFGNVAPEAAMSMFRKTQDVISGAGGGIQSPEQAMQFVMMRKPGESYTDTLKRMMDQGSDIERFQNLAGKAGGDENLKLMLMKEYGYNVPQAEAYMTTMRQRIKINQDIAAGKVTLGGGFDWTSTVMDENRAKWGAKYQRDTLLSGASNVVGDVVQKATKALLGAGKSPETRELQDLLGGRYGFLNSITKGTGYAKSLGSYSDYVGGENKDFLSLMPASLQPFLSGMLNQRDTGTMRTAMATNPVAMNMLPELALYQQWKKDPKSVTAEENTYLKKYSSAFEQVTGYLGTGKGTIGGQLGSSPDALENLAQLLFTANDANLDGNKGIYSIVEILEAIKQGIANGVFTPASK